MGLLPKDEVEFERKKKKLFDEYERKFEEWKKKGEEFYNKLKKEELY